MGLLDKARDVAKQASEVATKAVDQAKEKGQEFQLQRRLNGLAEDLGQVVFRQRTGEAGLDAEVDRLVAEMSATKTEIDQLEAD